MVNLIKIFTLKEPTKFMILCTMLLFMVVFSVSILILNSGPIVIDVDVEGFDTVNLTFDVSIPVPNTYSMSNLDRQNGYYIVKNTDPSTNTDNPKLKVKLPYGYYRVNDNQMAKIPYGFVVQPQGDDLTVDYTKIIIPKTASAAYGSANPNAYSTSSSFFAKGKSVSVPANREIPDGMYVLPDNQNQMAKLPPNMKPNIDRLEIEGSEVAPKLVKIYSNTIGYVSETEYYQKVFTLPGTNTNPNNVFKNITNNGGKAFKLPDVLYYYNNGNTKIASSQPNDTVWAQYDNPSATKVMFLPYGKVPKKGSGGEFLPGYIDNPYLISPTGNFTYNQNYSDVKTNYDVEFHANVDILKAQNDMYDINFGSITVLDQTGNLVVLPRSKVQGDITYYQPATFKFGAATYVPKYEDSVYLSRTSHMPTMAEYRSAFKTVGFCEENKVSPLLLEEKCGILNPETCSSTSCCVLLGGSKCVSGNANGPSMKQNYGDVFIRNKDFYTHMGKCYGNCP